MNSSHMPRPELAPVPWTSPSGEIAPVQNNGHTPIPYAYQTNNGHWNGAMSYSSYPTTPVRPEMGPSILEVLFKLCLARKSLLFTILVICAGISFFAIQQFGKQVFKVQGQMVYNQFRSDNELMRVYPALEIQSIVSNLKSPDILEQIRQKHHIDMPIDRMLKAVSVERVPSSDLINVGMESSDTELAATVVNEIMDLGLNKHNAMRDEQIKKSIERYNMNIKKFRGELADLQEQFQKRLEQKNVGNPKSEQESLLKEISELKIKLETVKTRQKFLTNQLESFQESIGESKDKNPNDAAADTKPRMTSAQEVQLEEVESSLRIKQEEHAMALRQYQTNLQYYRKSGAIPKKDVDDSYMVVMKLDEEINSLKKKIRILEKPSPISTLLPSPSDPAASIVQNMALVKAELKGLPEEVASLEKQLDEKNKRFKHVTLVVNETEPMVTEIGMASQKLIEENKLLGNAERYLSTKDQSVDLRIGGRGSSTGGTPVSSNYVKLTAAIFGLGILCFVGFVALTDLPQAMKKAAPSTALVPTHPEGNGVSHLHGTTQLHVNRIAEPNGSDFRNGSSTTVPLTTNLPHIAIGLARSMPGPGSIVLFIPVEGANVEGLVAELGKLYSRQAEHTLIFDARSTVRQPVVPVVAHAQVSRIESFLDGECEDPTACFAPTQIPSVEYTRGDLASRLQHGMMGMYRLRYLVEEMRQRFSRILMIAPPVEDADTLELFTTFTEGVVLVLHEQTDPSQVDAYVNALSNAQTPVLGTVVVGS